MSHFQLFDTVELTEKVLLLHHFSNEEDPTHIALVGTVGAIVEVLDEGEAYLVELFGNWVKINESGDFLPAEPNDSEAFRETIGLETVYSHQLRLVQSTGELIAAKTEVINILDGLSKDLIGEVKDFAEFLAQKHQRQAQER